MSNEELKYLAELLAKLERANETLRYSYGICSGIGIKTATTRRRRTGLNL